MLWSHWKDYYDHGLNERPSVGSRIWRDSSSYYNSSIFGDVELYQLAAHSEEEPWPAPGAITTIRAAAPLIYTRGLASCRVDAATPAPRQPALGSLNYINSLSSYMPFLSTACCRAASYTRSRRLRERSARFQNVICRFIVYVVFVCLSDVYFKTVEEISNVDEML